MFERQVQNVSSEPAYQRKKNLYHVMIRKREREAIIGRLRRNADLPEDLRECLDDLPKGMPELLGRILSREVFEWQETIADFILHKMKQKIGDLLEGPTLSGHQIITLFVFLLNRGRQAETLYKEHYGLILNKSKSWAFTVKVELYTLFTSMLKNGHNFVLQDAQKLHASLHCNRFFLSQLHFYNQIVKKHSNSQHMATFLSHATLTRLSQQLPCHFYNDDEKQAMMDILIQVLYASQEKDVSNCFNLEQIFRAGQYLLGHCKRNKMLTDRSILLIYNINIDAGSQQFVENNCFKVMTAEMKNSENPGKLRSLMGELFLNAIFFYPQEQFYNFVKENTELIFENLQYIFQEFSSSAEVEELALQLLQLIFNFATLSEQQPSKGPIISYLNTHQSFFKALRFLKSSSQLLDEYPILKAQDLP